MVNFNPETYVSLARETLIFDVNGVAEHFPNDCPCIYIRVAAEQQQLPGIRQFPQFHRT